MNHELGWEIAETANALRRYFDRRAQDLGITRSQWKVLARLRREPGQKQVCLADRLDIEPITLSRIIDRLEQSGLVSREPDPADRRAWRLYLTPQAEPIMAKLFGLADEVSDEVFAGISGDQINDLRGTLNVIRGNIDGQELARKAVA